MDTIDQGTKHGLDWDFATDREAAKFGAEEKLFCR